MKPITSFAAAIVAASLLLSIQLSAQCVFTPQLISATPFSATEIRVTWQRAIPLSETDPDIHVTYTNGIEYKLPSELGWTKIINPPNGLATIPGLTPGTTYQVRVWVNSSCQYTDPENGNPTFNQNYTSPAITVLTYPAAPVLRSVTSPSATGITIAWNLSSGTVNGYLVDVATDATFTQLVDENFSLSNATDTYARSIFEPGKVYYYRLTAVNNSGESTPVTGNIITRPAAPGVQNPVEVRSQAFKATWSSVTGAASYQLDVSTENTFGSFIVNNRSEAAAPSADVTALAPNTNYHYRVRAVNASGASVNSDIKTFKTAPASPTLFDKSNITSSGFQVNWSASVGATEYDLYVYTDASFTIPVEGYNPKTIAAPETTSIVAGLTPSTTYYLKLQARNAPRAANSGSDMVELLATTTATGGGGSLTFGDVTFEPTFIDGTPNVLHATVNGGTGAIQVKMFHRTNSASAFTATTLTLTSGTYQISVLNDWVDELGMQFYLEARDAVNQVALKENLSIKRKVASVTIPLLSAGKELNNYQMISFPYSLPDNSLRNALESVLGNYDKKKWRFSYYKNNKLVDFDEGLAAGNLTQGQAYWIISKNPVTLTWNDGVSFGNHTNAPASIQLSQGWNQVGNPFPFQISWQDVLNNNSSVSDKVSPLYLYDQELISFAQGDQLPVFGGGFVYADEALQLNFPVSLKNQGVSSGKTVRTNALRANDSEEVVWALPLKVQGGNSVNVLSGLGMRQEHDVRNGRDKYDVLSPPMLSGMRLVHEGLKNSPEVSFNWVPDSTRHVWHYTVKGDYAEAVISWNSTDVTTIQGSLSLYNATQGILMNMKLLNHHTVNAGDNIFITYSNQERALQPELRIGTAYPNPFYDHVSILLYAPGESLSARYELQVTDVTGKTVYRASHDFRTAEEGLLRAEWNGQSLSGLPLPSGLYFYQVKQSDGANPTVTFTGKIIRN